MRKNSTPPIAFTSAALLALALSAILIGAQAAQLNSQIPFQGKLTDNNGKPIDGTAKIKIEIYDAASAGNLLWSDTFSTVQVKKGIFSVYLGSGASKLTSDVAKDSPLYAQVFVNDKKLDPRIPVVSGLKVYSADKADSATSADSAATAAALSGTLDAAKITGPGKIKDAQIDTVSASKISGVVAQSNLPIATGSASYASGTPINYGKTLSNPIVVCSAFTIGRVCNINKNNVGATSFKPIIFDSSGNEVTDTIYWIAIGSSAS